VSVVRVHCTFQCEELVCATDTSIRNNNVTTLVWRVGDSLLEHMKLILPGGCIAFDELRISTRVSHRSKSCISVLALRREFGLDVISSFLIDVAKSHVCPVY
jgi:hypothetical protein